MSQLQMLVTGANGFVARALCSQTLAYGAIVRGVIRDLNDLPKGVAT